MCRVRFLNTLYEEFGRGIEEVMFIKPIGAIAIFRIVIGMRCSLHSYRYFHCSAPSSFCIGSVSQEKLAGKVVVTAIKGQENQKTHVWRKNEKENAKSKGWNHMGKAKTVRNLDFVNHLIWKKRRLITRYRKVTVQRKGVKPTKACVEE
ncbi:hypothetical protein L1887_11369 [Cichorium endivia]|nr:hypothetical protein L1887_11369 [Cichorium endivia]